MAKNHLEMADDILSSLRTPNAPEKVLLEVYLEVMIKRHRKEAVDEIITMCDEDIDNPVVWRLKNKILTFKERIK